jgi:hypothetical protein
MNAISEAKELRRRINKMLDDLDTYSNEFEINLNDGAIEMRADAIKTILFVFRNELDIVIDEWDAEKGIDRPL